jgi:hypothetical protein
LVRRGGRRPHSRRFVDAPQHLTDLHVVAILAGDAAEDAGLRGTDLEIDLVGLELDEGITGRYGFPFLPQPLGDARVDDRLTDLRDQDVYWHNENFLIR